MYYTVLWGCTSRGNLFGLKIRRHALQIKTRSYIKAECNTRVMSSVTCPAISIYTDTILRTVKRGLSVNAFKQYMTHSVEVQNLAPGNEAVYTRVRKFAKCDCQHLRICPSFRMKRLFSRYDNIS